MSTSCRLAGSCGSDITSGRESKSCTSNFVIIVNSKYALFIILKADIIYGMHIAIAPAG